MPSRCVAANCSNTNKDGVSLFKFSKELSLRSQWTAQVQRTRQGWSPSTSSVLCSAHFTESCFDNKPLLKESLGFNVQHKVILLPDAIPSLFKRPKQKSPVKRKTLAIAKRQRLEVGTQTACRPQLVTMGTQTKESCLRDEYVDHEDIVSLSYRDRPESDASEFIQSSAGSSDGESDMDAGHDNGHNEEQRPRHQDNIYLIYWNCLLGLFAWCSCPSCGSKQIVSRRHEIGTLLIVTIICQDCGRRSPWHSQPYLGSFAAGNIMLSASILFAGATATKVLRSNEVGGSYHMEQEGLVRALQLLEKNFVEVDTLVTDRHMSINKMLRENHPAIEHLFDIWHVAKGIKKKLQTLAKNRDCQTLKPWVSSIVNHLY
ncbi:hypothetical protein F7725_020145 [Dissostichus mawsoni]|uniref:THAP-type domain-containing protein n=1 Tax=Dissostichus mawsoni TaxID=36200 RepID=A0A7J5YF00_DISMA|nr:hypothetical protein F7725_020145 [Dissostichus mawsoni]